MITNAIVTGSVGLVGLGLVELVADLGPWEKVAVGAVSVVVGLVAIEFFERWRRDREAQKQAMLTKQREEEERRAELAKFTEEARFILHHLKLAPDKQFLTFGDLGGHSIEINHFKINELTGKGIETARDEFVAFQKAIRTLERAGLIERIHDSRISTSYGVTPDGWDFQPQIPSSKTAADWSVIKDYAKDRRAPDGRLQ